MTDDRRWPASMRKATAAEYLDVSPTTFGDIVNKYRIPSIQHFPRGDRYWLREDLDEYLTERRKALVVA